MKLIDIGEKGKLDKVIPKEKFFEDKNPLSDLIESITWTGIIKPEIMDVVPVVTDAVRYEEIQFFKVIIHNRESIFDIGRIIYSKIKYPCVIEFQCNDTVIIGCCKFKPGKNDNGKNVALQPFFSHVLRKELLSPLAEKMIYKINEQVSSPRGSIEDIYNAICNSIINYSLSGTSKSHVVRLIRNMISKAGPAKQRDVMQYAVPYEYHPLTSGNRFNGTRSSNYITIYDYEEIWYCFMMCPDVKSVIEYRRYRDIEDLIYSIDSKR